MDPAGIALPMKRIALKIDADTYHGTLAGVPALSEMLLRHKASGTFFFALGPDHSGREARSSSLGNLYDLKTRLYGRLLPGPDIGTRCVEILRQTKDAGFEVGIHAWDRVAWGKKVLQADNPWVEIEMGKACARFAEVFSDTARAHGAAGWRMNRHALRLTQRLGFSYSSDSRGSQPYIPVIDGELVVCPQLPTTLPTLDEILAMEPGITPEQAVDRILQLSSAIAGDHVFTLRAELEGMKFVSAFEHLLAGWKSKEYRLVALRDIHSTLDVKDLPRHCVVFAENPGRTGLRMTQGPVFLQD
jgi:undecaprenyl phosphate-alpha-L-ara4FN deformylase